MIKVNIIEKKKQTHDGVSLELTLGLSEGDSLGLAEGFKEGDSLGFVLNSSEGNEFRDCYSRECCCRKRS